MTVCSRNIKPTLALLLIAHSIFFASTTRAAAGKDATHYRPLERSLASMELPQTLPLANDCFNLLCETGRVSFINGSPVPITVPGGTICCADLRCNYVDSGLETPVQVEEWLEEGIAISDGYGEEWSILTWEQGSPVIYDADGRRCNLVPVS